jgi:AcrR family transcriptional regulator
VKSKAKSGAAHDLCVIVAHKPDRQSASSPRDARVVKSRQALEGALLALLAEKTFDQITIREIAAAAGISYATFFRHHATKDALLDNIAADQVHRLIALALPLLDRIDSHAAVLALCAYVHERRALWKGLLTGGAAATMREEMLRISRDLAIERAPRDAWIPVELAVKCSVSLIFETLAWWLAAPQKDITVEQLAVVLDRLLSALQVRGAV